MMRCWLSTFSFAAALVGTSALAADGARGIGYAATGPIFDLPAGMSVERLEVHVSFHSVRLAYVFKSRKPQTVHFRFALPDMPVDASEDIAALDKNYKAAGLAADTQPANYMNLSVRADGKPVVLGGHGRALLNGKDVTRQLLDAGVPLLSGPDGSAWRHLAPEVRTELEASGLMNVDAAAWTYQADFEWDQTFEPGETRVDVSYVTLANYWSDITVDHFPEIAPGGPETRAYCIDDALRRPSFASLFLTTFTPSRISLPHRAGGAGRSATIGWWSTRGLRPIWSRSVRWRQERFRPRHSSGPPPITTKAAKPASCSS